MPAELDRIEEALTAALAALAAAEPEAWHSPAARAYVERLGEVRDATQRLRSGLGAARAAVARLEVERAAQAALRAGSGVPW